MLKTHATRAANSTPLKRRSDLPEKVLDDPRSPLFNNENKEPTEYFSTPPNSPKLMAPPPSPVSIRTKSSPEAPYKCLKLEDGVLNMNLVPNHGRHLQFR